MATLQDVAARAGVSTATVSKVLSNTPYVSEPTRQRVMLAISELGYKPNLAARALSTGRTHIIAVVFPYIYDPIFKDPLVMHILEGIEAEISSQDYNMLLSAPRLAQDAVDPAYQQLIDSGYIEGVIAIDSVPIASAASPALERGLPAVVLGYHSAPYTVRCDDRRGGALLMQHLLDLGHRRIGVISIAPDLNFAVNERISGMHQAAEAAGLTFEEFPIAFGDFSTESGAQALHELLDLDPDITAVVCINDRMALGAIQAARQRGLRVPRDLSIAGYDNISMGEVFMPPLTTIDQQASQMGRLTVRILLDVLQGKNPSSVVLEPLLIARTSTAAPRVASNHASLEGS